MLAKGIRKLKSFVFDSEIEDLVLERFSDNPLVAYLQVHFQQHRSITMLYRVILLAFLGFMGVVSALIVTNLESPFVPEWGHAALLAVNLLLLAGTFMGLKHLRNYRRSSQSQLAEVYELLKKDLTRLENLQVDHSFISKAQKSLKSRLQKMGNVLDGPVDDYEGWDATKCPDCGIKLEMLSTDCPNCGHDFADAVKN
ncbi:MAG: hypothetical protein QNL04_04955 [SAR324 cluster bacterium]|nr:hypothetical protein [SAR324 cluster bacterium]